MMSVFLVGVNKKSSTKNYIAYKRARAQSLICIPLMPAQSCDLIHASDWCALYVARATRALYMFVQTPSLRVRERGLGTRLGYSYSSSTETFTQARPKHAGPE